MRKILTFFLISIGTLISVELSSFAYLSYRNAMTQNSSFAKEAEALWARHPVNANILTFGEYDPVLSQRYTPHKKQGKLWVNSYGFIANDEPELADSEFPSKSDGTYRIILLGGSSMAGNALQSDNTHTIASYLERALNQRSSLAGTRYQKFQVLNWGYSGAYSFTEMVRFLSDGIYLQPDAVIALDGWNDSVQASFEHVRNFMDQPLMNWGSLHYMYYDKMYGLKDNAQRAPAFFTFSFLLLSDFGFIKSAEETRQDYYSRSAVTNFSKSIEKTGLWKPTDNLIKNWDVLASWCDRNDVRFFGYLQPFAGYERKSSQEDDMLQKLHAVLNQVHGKEWSKPIYDKMMSTNFALYRRGRQALEEKYLHNPDIKFFDLTKLFQNEPRLIYLDQIHYNELGNSLIAERFLKDLSF